MNKSKLQNLEKEKKSLIKRLMVVNSEIERQNKQKLILTTLEEGTKSIIQTSYCDELADVSKENKQYREFVRYYRQGDTTICRYHGCEGKCTKSYHDDDNQLVALRIAGARARANYWNKVAEELINELP